MNCDVCGKRATHDIFLGRFCDACVEGINRAIAEMNSLPKGASCGSCAHFVLGYWCSKLEVKNGRDGACRHWASAVFEPDGQWGMY